MHIILSVAWQITGVILFLSLCIVVGLNLVYPEWAKYILEDEEEAKNDLKIIYMIKSKK